MNCLPKNFQLSLRCANRRGSVADLLCLPSELFVPCNFALEPPEYPFSFTSFSCLHTDDSLSFLSIGRNKVLQSFLPTRISKKCLMWTVILGVAPMTGVTPLPHHEGSDVLTMRSQTMTSGQSEPKEFRDKPSCNAINDRNKHLQSSSCVISTINHHFSSPWFCVSYLWFLTELLFLIGVGEREGRR